MLLNNALHNIVMSTPIFFVMNNAIIWKQVSTTYQLIVRYMAHLIILNKD